MDKSNPPESLGVFKPVGHVLLALRSAARLDEAERALLAQGFTAADMVRYTPQEMQAQVDGELLRASPLAQLGQELNLVKEHRELALGGCSFLVVHAPDDDQAAKVAAAAQALGAVSAQRYGRFLIEELLPADPRQAQVFESPERGQDAPEPSSPH